MSSNPEIDEFISSYTAADRERIAFKWNGKHAEELEDDNLKFRGLVLDALAEGATASPQLLADLFDEETSFSVEVWGARDGLMELAQRLLIEGGTEHVLVFIYGKWKSFDTEMACTGMEIPEENLRALLAYCQARQGADEPDGKAYAGGAQYFSELLA